MSMKAGFTPTENGQTPLFNAARHGHRDIVNRLCDARAPLAATERHGANAIFAAAREGHAAVVALLKGLRGGLDAMLRRKFLSPEEPFAGDDQVELARTILKTDGMGWAL